MKSIRTLGRQIATLALVLGLTAAPRAGAAPSQTNSQGKEFRYRYVSLNDVVAASGLDPSASFFDPIAIADSGRIYGTLYTCTDVCIEQIAFYAHGTLTARQTGIAYVANNEGTVGGSVLTDPDNFIEQAALFHGGQVELIPRQPGEITSSVTALNDSGIALVTSSDFSHATLVLYKNGKSTPLNLGPNISNPQFLKINNQGIISGSNLVSPGRGFRFNPWTGELTLLNPLPTEPESWATDINNRGESLGYSFVSGKLERIGVWDRKGKFATYFVEGTAQFPTVSNRLLFNENNPIVITAISSPPAELGNSYLVPKPGVRLNLADLVENLPTATLGGILDMNDNGDMLGERFVNFSLTDTFLLERMDNHDRGDH